MYIYIYIYFYIKIYTNQSALIESRNTTQSKTSSTSLFTRKFSVPQPNSATVTGAPERRRFWSYGAGSGKLPRAEACGAPCPS